MNQVRVDFERCKECSYCISFCPQKSLAMGEKVNKHGYYPPVYDATDCIACGICAKVCPEAALGVYKEV